MREFLACVHLGQGFGGVLRDGRRSRGEWEQRVLGSARGCPKEFGDFTFGWIEIEPFAATRFGAEFGLIVQAPEGPDEIWWVTAEPGDYMAFAAPWDCGIYDT